jgi:hypothetical protein
MEYGAEKFHNLHSASWRPKKEGSVAQSKPEGLRTTEFSDIVSV